MRFSSREEQLVYNTLRQEAFLLVNKKLCKVLGFIAAGLMAKLLEKHYRMKEKTEEELLRSVRKDGEKVKNLIRNEYFYCLQEDIEKEIGLSISHQNSSFDVIEQHGLVKRERGGLPSRYFYKIDFSAVTELLYSEGSAEQAYTSTCTETTTWKEPSVLPLKVQATIKNNKVKTILTNLSPYSPSENNPKELVKAVAADQPSAGPRSPLSTSSEKPSFKRNFNVKLDPEALKLVTTIKPKSKLEEIKDSLHKVKRPSRQADLKPPKPKKRTSKKTEAKNLDPKKNVAHELISFWNNSGLSKVSDTELRRTVISINAIMNGTFFTDKPSLQNDTYLRPFSKEEILLAIKNYALCALDPNYMPVDKETKKNLKYMPMLKWCYDDYKRESSFLRNLENEPQLFRPTSIVEDSAPAYTTSLKNEWKSKILLSTSVNGFASFQENHFRRAAAKLKDFFEANQNNLTGRFRRMPPHPYQCASWLINAMLEDADGQRNRVKLHFMSNDSTFNDTLPKYLIEQAILVGERD